MSTVTAPAKPETVTQVKHVATVEMVAAFITAILAGAPIGKIFPTKISEMEFTAEQRDQIWAARGQRKDWCKANKSRVLTLLRSKKFEADRITERPNRVGISAKNTAFVKPAKAAK